MVDPSMDRYGAASVLGKYRLVAELGHGGMAEVFLAVAQGPAGFSKLSVIKQIRPALAADPEFLAMFLDEARLAARLNHPNVVHTHEVGHEGNRYFIAMEFLEGQPLNRILHRVGRERLTLHAQLRVFIDVLAGLHYAHELSDYDGTPLEVVHRDITPHNVFVTYDGHVKIVDFGIAKAMNSSAETRTGVLKGKIAYMAPEQARGERVDRRADIFSVGIMLWEAAVGRRLWHGLPDVAVLSKLGNGEIPRPRSVAPNVTPELESVICKALAVNKEDRFPTAADLQYELERLLVGAGAMASLRELGRLLSQQFAEDRTRIKTLVDAQLREIRSLATDQYRAVQIPVLDMPTNATYAPASGLPDEMTKEPSSRTGPIATNTLQPGSVTSASTWGPRPPVSRTRRALFPLAAAVGALAAVASWMISHPTPVAQDAAGNAPAPSAATSANTVAASPNEIEVRVSARPAEAKIFFDDLPLPRNPGSRWFQRDGSVRTLRVEAPGYITEYRKFSCDKDFMLEIALEREPVPRAPAPKNVPSPPPAPTTKRRDARPVRPLDTANPFGP